MCGVPYHAAEQYIQRLLRKGHRIALCEQMEDPKLTKKIVRREVNRVLTPGTVVDSGLGAEQTNWLASTLCIRSSKFRPRRQRRRHRPRPPRPLHRRVPRHRVHRPHCPRAALRRTWPPPPSRDPLRGERRRAVQYSRLAVAFFSNLHPRTQPTTPSPGPRTIRPKDDSTANLRSTASAPASTLEDWVFTADYAIPLLRRHFGVHSLDGLGLAAHEAAAIAAGALLHYLQKIMQGGLEHIDTIRFFERSDCLILDSVSIRNLELKGRALSSPATSPSQTTLFHTLDACSTPMGKRLLRATLVRPSADGTEIESRLDAVAEAAGNLPLREALRRSMSGVLDLERLLGRVALDSAGPREVMALAATLACLPAVQSAVESFKSQHWKQIVSGGSFSSTVSSNRRFPYTAAPTLISPLRCISRTTSTDDFSTDFSTQISTAPSTNS